jgi:hypothetical protein
VVSGKLLQPLVGTSQPRRGVHSSDGGGAHLFKSWSMEELLTFPVPPAQLPKWRGRKPRWLLEVERAA